MKVLVIDNYDSFVFNLAQELGELGADPIVVRNDELDLDGARAFGARAMVISPGPGRPNGAGISLSLITSLAQTLPILGVCLGHQCIGQAFGSKVIAAPRIMHGKTSAIDHDKKGIYEGIDSPLQATRYHSLVIDRAPDTFVVSATAGDDGCIMGIRHRKLPIEGVQFHPESILTDAGLELLSNFLRISSSVSVPMS